MHARQLIRERVVAELLGTKTVGGKVFASIFHEVPPEDLPAIFVYAEEEAAEAGTMGSLAREAHLVVNLVHRAHDGVEDVLDDVAEEVERRLGDSRLDGAVYEGRLFETTFERSGEGDGEIMSMALRFAFRYMTAYNDPSQTTH